MQTLVRVLLEEEWARFLRYASWMTELKPLNGVIICDEVFQQLSAVTSVSVVCPQLRRLTWTSSYGWEPMQRFLSPHLESVVFLGDYWSGPDPALIPTISLLPTTHLQELTLKIPTPHTPIHSVLSEVIQRLGPRFKSLATWSSLSEAGWTHLASLPQLEWLRVSDVPRTEILKLVPHQHAFSALQCIEIRVDSVHQRLSLLFSLLKSSLLQEVTFTMGCRIQGADVPSQIITPMLEAELQRSINSLTFYGSESSDLVFLSHIGRFSSLKTLKCITTCLQTQCVFPLTDSDIEQLASELPQLMTVCLGHECVHIRLNTTIKSLISFSTRCPSLQTLSFPCDLTNISEDIKTDSGVPDPRLEISSPCKLQFLDLDMVVMPPPVDIEASRIVASALEHLFPCFTRERNWD